jgi:hypothetical protein
VANFIEAQEFLSNFTQLQGGGQFLYEFVVSLRGIWESRTLNALPDTNADAIFASANEIANVNQPKMARAVAWLDEHGRCMDHIVPGRSTIENAGHGAFAKRFLRKGTIISGSPLHHPLRNLLEMYDFEENPDANLTDVSKKFRRTNKIGHQLWLNYCYGHPESTLLLCPYGCGVNYINRN